MVAFKLKSWHASESAIKKSITDYLTILEHQGKLMFLRNNSFAGIIKAGGKESYIKNGKEGSPDLMVFLASAKKFITLNLEIKTVSGIQSEKQKQWEQKIKELGGFYYIIYRFEDVKYLLDYAFAKDLYNLREHVFSKMVLEESRT